MLRHRAVCQDVCAAVWFYLGLLYTTWCSPSRVAILANLWPDSGNLANFESVWLQIFWFGKFFGDFLMWFGSKFFGLAKDNKLSFFVRYSFKMCSNIIFIYTLYTRGGQTCSMYELHIVKPKLQRATTWKSKNTNIFATNACVTS